MAKRLADSQITRENFKENESDDDDSTSPNQKASSSVMSKRKIAIPKRKAGGSFQNPSFGNHFAQENQLNGVPFSVAKQNGNNNHDLKSYNSENTGKNESKDNDSEKYLKLKALNLQFKEKVVTCVDEDPCANLTPVLDKYKSFIDSITEKSFSLQSMTPVVAQNGTVPAPKKAEEESSESSEDEVEKPIKVEGPKFTLATKPTTSDSVFSFTAKKEQKDGGNTEFEVKGPQFNFSGTVKSDVFKLPTPSTATPTSSVAPPESVSKNDEKSSFSFIVNKKSDIKGDEPSDTSSNTNSNASNSKPPFAFTVPAKASQEEKKDTKPAPAFNFGTSNVQQSGTESRDNSKAPSFSFKFASNNEKTEDKPAFSFGGTSTTNKATEDKPSFSFGGTSTTNKDNTSVKPAFSFGSVNSSATPSFSFSKPSSTAAVDNKSDSSLGAPSGGFKFSLPFAQNSAGAKPQDIDGPKNGTADATNDETDASQNATSMNLQNGEEDEHLMFAQRSKLMLFNSETKAYDSKGVGEMKLLQQKDDKSKIRLLCRSDGMGNILLNTSLVKSFAYAPLAEDNENLVKIPVVEAEGKVATYVVKFKQKADGRQFVKSIEDAKKDM